MKVKVGDKVRVLAGADKGKEGKILLTLKAKDRVVVEGVNIVKKHQKPTRTNETGGILEIEAPIHVSNVKVLESSKSVVKKAEVKVEKKTTKTIKSTKTTKKSTKKEEVGETNE